MYGYNCWFSSTLHLLVFQHISTACTPTEPLLLWNRQLEWMVHYGCLPVEAVWNSAEQTSKHSSNCYLLHGIVSPTVWKQLWWPRSPEQWGGWRDAGSRNSSSGPAHQLKDTAPLPHPGVTKVMRRWSTKAATGTVICTGYLVPTLYFLVQTIDRFLFTGHSG